MIDVDDANLVRAPRWLVHRRLVEVDRWAWWWPGLVELGTGPVSGPVSGPGSGGIGTTRHVDLHLRRPWRPVRRLRLALTPHRPRPDLGLHVQVVGDVVAATELWLEDAPGGTLVHHVATVDEVAAPLGRAWRAAVRRAVWALDTRLAAEVRSAVGMVDRPGVPEAP